MHHHRLAVAALTYSLTTTRSLITLRLHPTPVVSSLSVPALIAGTRREDSARLRGGRRAGLAGSPWPPRAHFPGVDVDLPSRRGVAGEESRCSGWVPRKVTAPLDSGWA